MEFYRNVSKYDMSNFGLTVAPTLDCNFRCKYCFETHPKGVMSEEIQTALIKFVEERLINSVRFSVTWYGGEPLLTKNIIYNPSEKFLELYQKYAVDYKAFIITNGGFINDSYIENYKLIEGVNALANNNFRVIVRINVDKDNINYVEDLLKILRARIEKHDKLNIDFGQVFTFTEICRSIESDCRNNEQYADVMLPLYEKVNVYGFELNKMSVYPTPRMNFCCVKIPPLNSGIFSFAISLSIISASFSFATVSAIVDLPLAGSPIIKNALRSFFCAPLP